jgi:hypothetical protein
MENPPWQEICESLGHRKRNRIVRPDLGFYSNMQLLFFLVVVASTLAAAASMAFSKVFWVGLIVATGVQGGVATTIATTTSASRLPCSTQETIVMLRLQLDRRRFLKNMPLLVNYKKQDNAQL